MKKVLIALAILFTPFSAYAESIFTQTPSPTFNFEYYQFPGPGFVLGTVNIVLGNLFPLGHTFTSSDKMRISVGYFDTVGSPISVTWGIYDQTTGGGAVCVGNSTISTYSTYLTYTIDCSGAANTSNPGDILLLRLPGNGANTSAIFIQTAGGDVDATSSKPYFELTDTSGVFSGDPPSNEAPSGIVSPTISALGVQASSTSALCAGLSTATSSGFLSGLANDFSYGICYSVSFLLVPNQTSINNFSSINSQLNQKFPISWISNIRTILETGAASSTDNFINLDINFGTTTQKIGVGNLVVISTSTLSQYLSDSTRNSFKLLLTTIFWLTATAFIYRDLQKIWNKNIT